MKTEITKVFHDAVLAAIKEMGRNEFKKTSFFMSNDRHARRGRIKKSESLFDRESEE